MHKTKFAAVISATLMVLGFLNFATSADASSSKPIRAIKLATPTGVAIVPSSNSILVSFNSVSNATAYSIRVYAATSERLVGSPLRTISRSGNRISALTSNTVYRVSVQALGNEKTYSNSEESKKLSTRTTSSTPVTTTYSVTYYSNTADTGVAPTDGSSPYIQNATVTVLGNTGTLFKAGYTFAGWNTLANGTGTPRAALSTFAMPASNVGLYAQWTAVVPPTVTAVSPTSGTTDGGETITITGTGFANQATVTVGGVPCTLVSVVGTNTIMCFTSPHAASTSQDIVVTNADLGSGTGSGLFSYVTPTSTTATKYLVTSSTTNPRVGATNQISAQIADVNGVPIATPGVVVTWSQSNFHSHTAGRFASLTSVTDNSGIATVTFTSATAAGESTAIIATDANTRTGTSPAITTFTGTAAQYIVTSATLDSQVGTTNQISAQLADAFGNPVATPNLVVTWSQSDTASTKGTFALPTTSTTNSSGIATITFTASTTAGEITNITATDTNNLSGTSATITSLTGPATQYLVTAESYSRQVGTTEQIFAQLADSFGNPVATPNLVVTWSQSDTAGSKGTIAAPSTSTTNNLGLATITFTTSSVVGESTNITATDTNSLTGVSAMITAVNDPNTYMISTSVTKSLTAGTNTITPTLSGIAFGTQNVVINFTAGMGVHLVSFTIDGAGSPTYIYSNTTTSSDSFTFSSITANHTIDVVTAPNTGPGGGTVFYASANGFACGPTLSSVCHYLEYAPLNWAPARHYYSGGEPPGIAVIPIVKEQFTRSRVQVFNGFVADNIGIGGGHPNSSAFVAQNGVCADINTCTYGFGTVAAYSPGGVGTWYIPDNGELIQLCKFIKGLNWTSDSTLCGSSGSLIAAYGTNGGLVSSTEYSDSEQHYIGLNQGQINGSGKPTEGPILPIRAF